MRASEGFQRSPHRPGDRIASGGSKALFAFYVIGSSMSPAIEHGDQVMVNPSMRLD